MTTLATRSNAPSTRPAPVRRALRWAVPAGLALLAFTVIVALGLGAVRLPPAEVLQALFDRSGSDATASAIVWSIRLPRVIVAVLVGAALAAAGTAMQAILRNPLAEPGVTGVSAGAAFGAVVGITVGLASSLQWGVPIAAFIGAGVVAGILNLVMVLRRDVGTTGIILVGVALNSLAGAGIAALIANARDDALARGALFWLAGDLALRDWSHVAIAVCPIVVGTAYLLARTRALDVLSLGADVATTSGIDVHRTRLIILMAASLVTGAAVAVSGVIAFVGLVVPHAVRLIVGAAHARLLPLAMLAGAIFLLVADTIARAGLGTVVLPTGVVSALVGAPVFLALLLRRRA